MSTKKNVGAHHSSARFIAQVLRQKTTSTTLVGFSNRIPNIPKVMKAITCLAYGLKEANENLEKISFSTFLVVPNSRFWCCFIKHAKSKHY